MTTAGMDRDGSKASRMLWGIIGDPALPSPGLKEFSRGRSAWKKGCRDSAGSRFLLEGMLRRLA